MKAKNILALKARLEQTTEEKVISKADSTEVAIRFDAWEELVFIREDDKEVRLNLTEAKKLKTLLDRLV